MAYITAVGLEASCHSTLLAVISVCITVYVNVYMPLRLCVSDDGCEELRFARLMDSHVCYDLIPHTSKLVVFDTQLTVIKYFAVTHTHLELKPVI